MSHAVSTTHGKLAFHHAVLRRKPEPENLVDAVISAGAFAAWADGSVHPIERLEMLVYIRRSGLFLLRRRDVLQLFDRRVRALQNDSASARRQILDLVGNFSGSSGVWIVLRAAEHVAAADSQMQGAELMAIRSIRVALGMPPDRFGAQLLA